MATICPEQDKSVINMNPDSASAFRSHRKSVFSLVSAFGHRIQQWVERRREQRESRAAFTYLLQLDDSLLRDIGVSRAEVERASKLPLAEDAAQVLYEATGRHRDNRA